MTVAKERSLSCQVELKPAGLRLQPAQVQEITPPATAAGGCGTIRRDADDRAVGLPADIYRQIALRISLRLLSKREKRHIFTAAQVCRIFLRLPQDMGNRFAIGVQDPDIAKIGASGCTVDLVGHHQRIYGPVPFDVQEKPVGEILRVQAGAGRTERIQEKKQKG